MGNSVSYASNAMSAQEKHEWLQSVQPGDIIMFKRGLSIYWAIYVGNGKVIHFSDACLNIGGRIIEEEIWDVIGQHKARVHNGRDDRWNPLPPEEIVQRARYALETSERNLSLHNSEHFAIYCRYGQMNNAQLIFLAD
ncbi:unnamed protein product [Rotaria sordida]|uniref:LRAT domain-containing protein n=1 Tax=Rotaria sordida TaxID=392033 RepID=A0A814XHB0_9BILA|nr:unnamed protein product [Rotaria sordida]